MTTNNCSEPLMQRAPVSVIRRSLDPSQGCLHIAQPDFSVRAAKRRVPPPAALPSLSLTPTRASSISMAAQQTRSGKTAVAANTPRVPHDSTSAPLKYALTMPPTALLAQQRL